MARMGYGHNVPGAYSYKHRRAPYPAPQRPPQKSEPCVIYTRTGLCDQRKTCRYQHDSSRVALCQQFLKSGRCAKPGGERCYLSHEPRPGNTPMCDYFARGRCNNEQCKFTHMTNLGEAPLSAPVCRTFALNGWCDRGAKCTKRHSYQCPDFEAHGSCANRECKLEHVIASSKGEPRVPKKVLNPVNLKLFLNFLEHTTREKFDAETRHVSSTIRSFEEDSTSEQADEGVDDTESESASDWEDGSDSSTDDLDVNADFIKV